MSRFHCCRLVDYCKYGKELIKHAFNNEVWLDAEDEKGFIYEKCTKERAEKEILDVYDDLVLQLFNLNAGACAHEKISERQGCKVNMIEYAKEAGKLFKEKGYDEYEFEDPKEDEEDPFWGLVEK